MARQIRKKSGTGIYHIMLRGIPLMIQSLEKVRRNEILITAKAMGYAALLSKETTPMILGTCVEKMKINAKIFGNNIICYNLCIHVSDINL